VEKSSRLKKNWNSTAKQSIRNDNLILLLNGLSLSTCRGLTLMLISPNLILLLNGLSLSTCRGLTLMLISPTV